jgi:hypothetical protein
MAIHKGRAVRVEIAATYSAPKTVSAISKASPGQATSTAHALAEGAIGYFSAVGGMTELEDQVASVDATATNTFNLEGIDTTNFGTFSTSASFTPVATWATLAAATGYEIGGGDVEQLDTTTLLDNQRQQDVGMLGLQTLSLNMFSDVQAPAMALLMAAARANGMVVIRMTLSNGERRICRGYPALPSESLAVNQVATGGIQIVTKKQLLLLPVA